MSTAEKPTMTVSMDVPAGKARVVVIVDGFYVAFELDREDLADATKMADRMRSAHYSLGHKT